MLPFQLGLIDGPVHLVALGAHPDDIEIGCGGTLLALKDSGRPLVVRWIVLSTQGERREEARASADELLDGVTDAELVFHDFRDGFLPYAGAPVKEAVEDAKGFEPHVVFTHQRHDLHQDHRLLCELTWNTFRDHLILEYEIPKYDGDLGRPAIYVQLTSAQADAKVAAIREGFPSQAERPWFSDETFRSLMRLRGIESRSPDGYAEAFHCRKLVLT